MLMSLDRLAERTGESPAELRRWAGLGLLQGEADAGIPADSAERAWLVRFALDRGYAAQGLAELNRAHGDMIGSLVGLFVAVRGEPAGSPAEAASRAGSRRRCSSSWRRRPECGSSVWPMPTTWQRSV
jgi:hypothetical protein